MRIKNNLDKIKIYINNEEITHEQVDKYELKRMKKTFKFLRKKGFQLDNSLLKLDTLDDARNHLAEVKMTRSADQLRDMLKTEIKLGDKAAHTMVKLSRGKRKYCITDFLFETDMTIQEFYDAMYDILMNNTSKHFFMNIATNPDHYVLLGDKGNTSEVLENPANSPLPFRFWGDYDDVSAVQSEFTEGYTMRLAGPAVLKDGLVMGAMHHQLKQEDGAIRFKAVVEFPSVLPNYNFRMHHYHLACEFRQWIGYVINNI